METFLYSLATLIITGLGFITYWHPKTGRHIVYLLIGCTFVLYLFIIVYQRGQNSGFHKSIDVLGKSILKPNIKNIDFDSLKNRYENNPDTIRKIMNKYENSLLEYGKKIKRKHELIEKLLNSESKTQVSINSLYSYFYIAFGVLIALFILSFVFQNLRQPNSIKQNDSTN